MKKLLIQSTVFAMILLSACSHSSPPQDALPANSTLTATESSLQSVNETTSPGIEAKESCSQPGSGFSDTENMQTSTGPVKKEPVTTGIPDGDRIRISRADGSQDDKTCRYIDQYHLEVGRNLYHICEFAELMEQNGSTVIPLRSSLPEQCYGTLASTGELIIIRKGESGYYRTDIDTGSKEANRSLSEEQNRLSGVTKAQAEAMSAGSMFGWATPAANPANYDENGKIIHSKVKERNDAR